MSLHKSLGFVDNPFSTFSAEEEDDFLIKVFKDPLFYDSLYSDLSKGLSRYVLGARGTGKTALFIRLKDQLDKNNILSVIIDEYSRVRKTNNKLDFLQLIIESTVTHLSLILVSKNKKLSKLNSIEKEKLSLFIREFYQTVSDREYEKYYGKASGYKRKNFLKVLWNKLLNKPVNLFLSSGVEILSDTIRKSLGLNEDIKAKTYKQYLPELPIEDIRRKGKKRFDERVLKEILNDLSLIIKKIGFSTTVILFDKIDEYEELHKGNSAVSTFLTPLLKDTTVLMNSNYSLVFSLWDVLRPQLSDQEVRFDKIKPIDITWSDEDLIDILEKRINYFSNGKKSTKDIVPYKPDLNNIIELSNNSPRSLFRILSLIYDVQAEINSTSNCLSTEAVGKGCLNYAKTFDFYLVYPSKRGTSNDIKTCVNRLLKINKETVLVKDYKRIFTVTDPTANKYIKNSQEYNLVKESSEIDKHGAKKYTVIDPTILFLIKNNITEI